MEVTLYSKGEFGDKNFNIQFKGISAAQKNIIKALVHHDDDFRHAMAFIQGEIDDWFMVEFHSSDFDQVRASGQKLLLALQEENHAYSCKTTWKFFKPVPQHIAETIMVRVKREASVSPLESQFSHCKTVMYHAIAEHIANDCGYTFLTPKEEG